MLYKHNRIFPLHIASRHGTLTTLQRGICVLSAESGKSQLISRSQICLLEHCDSGDLSLYKSITMKYTSSFLRAKVCYVTTALCTI
jgi:hypothetical protein